jgi:hypothetical protein
MITEVHIVHGSDVSAPESEYRIVRAYQLDVKNADSSPALLGIFDDLSMLVLELQLVPKAIDMALRGRRMFYDVVEDD